MRTHADANPGITRYPLAIPLKSPCQPFSLELSNPGVCTQALNLLGFVSPGRAVCQRRVITHRVSLAPLRFKTSCPHPQGASYVLPSADIIPLWPRISSAKSGPNSIAKGRCEEFAGWDILSLWVILASSCSLTTLHEVLQRLLATWSDKAYSVTVSSSS